MKTDVLVIGAGISGLTAASLLAKSGLDVVVVDKRCCINSFWKYIPMWTLDF